MFEGDVDSIGKSRQSTDAITASHDELICMYMENPSHRHRNNSDKMYETNECFECSFALRVESPMV